MRDAGQWTLLRTPLKPATTYDKASEMHGGSAHQLTCTIPGTCQRLLKERAQGRLKQNISQSTDVEGFILGGGQ